MAPLLARLANLSFSSGVFPSRHKLGQIKPLLKKPGLDKDDPANYRPITNLSTTSKILEKLALARLRPHILASPNFSEFQSAYRTGHSTETAVVRLVNDIACSAAVGKVTVLLSLDISAAFDTLDHNILCQRAKSDFGLTGVALDWIRSFLSDRKQCVSIDSSKSQTTPCLTGVPQGSVLGPLLFALYVTPVGDVAKAHRMCYHQYADDLQLYVALSPQSAADLTTVSACADDVRTWFLQNCMLLNASKTDAIIFGTVPRMRQLNVSGGIVVAGATVNFSDCIKILGVKLDSTLSFNKHVSDIVRICNYHLRALRHIRPLLTRDVAALVGSSIVQSRLDYCNAVLYDTSARNIDRLQKVQNALARVVCQASWTSSATELRKSLHWLPIEHRINYKIALLTYKAKQSGQPAYIASLLRNTIPARDTRSSGQQRLDKPFYKINFSDKSFSVAAPVIWNSLKLSTKSAETLGIFKSRLKSELFDIAYPI